MSMRFVSGRFATLNGTDVVVGPNLVGTSSATTERRRRAAGARGGRQYRDEHRDVFEPIHGTAPNTPKGQSESAGGRFCGAYDAGLLGTRHEDRDCTGAQQVEAAVAALLSEGKT